MSNNEVNRLNSTQYAIINELSETLNSLGAERGVFAALHSWGDTLPEEDVLQMLKDMNKPIKQRDFAKKHMQNISEQDVMQNIQEAYSICRDFFADTNPTIVLQTASEVRECQNAKMVNTNLEEMRMELRSIADLIANQTNDI